MALLLREIAANGSITDHDLAGMSNVEVTEGSTYSLIDSETQLPVDGADLIRDGEDLVLQVEGETVAQVEDFYGEGAGASYSDGGSVVSTTTDAGEAVWQAEEAAVAGSGMSGTTMGLIGGGALLLAAAGGGGGGGSSGGGGGGTTPPAIVTVDAAAGPFITTMGVQIHGADGTLLQSIQHDFSTGPINVEIDGDYSGAILVTVTDINGTAVDYLDEATNTQLSLGAESIRAMAVTDANGDATVSVTPLTELAVRLAGIGADNVVSEADVASNDQVAELFGVTDILGDVITIVDDEFDSTDGLNAAEAYGTILAILSGVDSVSGGIEETLTALEDAITETDGTLGLDQEAAELISEGLAAVLDGESGDEIVDVVDDVLPDDIQDQVAPVISSVVVTTNSLVEVTFDDVPDNMEAADFTIVVNGEDYSFESLSIDGLVVTLTPTQDIYAADTVSELSTTASDFGGNVPVAVTTITNNSIGFVEEFSAAYDELTPTSALAIEQTGLEGNDLLSVNIVEPTDFDSNTANRAIHSLDIEQSGAGGNDNIVATLEGQFIGGEVDGTSVPTASSLTSSFSTVIDSRNSVDQQGGAGDDSLSINILAAAPEVESLLVNNRFVAGVTATSSNPIIVTETYTRTDAYAEVVGNNLNQVGGVGSDSLAVDIQAAATAETTTGTAALTGNASATIADNTIYADGQGGVDQVTYNLHAEASADRQANAAVSDNWLIAYAETIDIDLVASAVAESSARANVNSETSPGNVIAAVGTNVDVDFVANAAAESYAYAAVNSNDQIMLIGDQVSLDLIARANGGVGTAEELLYAIYAAASVDYNDITLSANSEASLNLVASARGETEANASVYDNYASVIGQSSADDLDIYLLADANVVTHQDHTLNVDATAYVGDNRVNIWGAGGEDDIYAQFAANASILADTDSDQASAGASNYANELVVYGGDTDSSADGNDLIAAYFTAAIQVGGASLSDADAASTESARAWLYGYAEASNNYNEIYFYGNSGSDNLAVNFRVNALLDLAGDAIAIAEGTGTARGYAYLTASAYSVSNAYNEVGLYGGTSNSSRDIADGVDMLAVNFSASATAHAAGFALAAGASEPTTALGAYDLAGDSARAQIDAYAYYVRNQSNDVAMVGYSGADQLDLNVIAQGSANASGRAEAWGSENNAGISASQTAYNSYSDYALYGGASGSQFSIADGNDLISVVMQATGNARAQGTAVANGANSADASIGAEAEAYNRNQDLYIAGSAGADTISVIAEANGYAEAGGLVQAIGSTDASADITADALIQPLDGAYITINGGNPNGSSNDGADVINVALMGEVAARATGMVSASAPAAGSAYLYATFSANADYSNSANEINVFGSAGADQIEVAYGGTANATASGGLQLENAGNRAYGYFSANAQIENSESQIALYGGDANGGADGADTIMFSVDQQANALAMGSVTVTALNAASATSGDARATLSASADFTYYGNTVSVYGSADADLIDIQINGAARATASGEVNANGGPDVSVRAYLSAEASADIADNTFSVFGGDGMGGAADGADTINIELGVAANAHAVGDAYASAQSSESRAQVHGYGYAEVYDNNFLIQGSDGADMIALDLHATASAMATGNAFNLQAPSVNESPVYASASAYVSENSVSIHGDNNSTAASSDGADNISVNMRANVQVQALAAGDGTTAQDVYEYGYAYMYANEVYAEGGAGDDVVSLNMSADISALNGSAYAYNSYNDISFYGSSGADMLSVYLGAEANAGSDYATVSANNNEVYLYGGSSADTLNLDISVIANVGSVSAANAYASVYIYNNTVSMIGSSGDDIINLGLIAQAAASGTNAISGYAGISSNSIGIYGGAGLDTIGVTIEAEYFGFNTIGIDGGDGADVFNFDIAVTGSSSNQYNFTYDAVGDFGDSINGMNAGIFSNNVINFDFYGFTGATFVSSVTNTAEVFYYDTYGTGTGTTQSFALYYDADGTGTGAASAVAIFDTDVGLDASDINIIIAP